MSERGELLERIAEEARVLADELNDQMDGRYDHIADGVRRALGELDNYDSQRVGSEAE